MSPGTWYSFSDQYRTGLQNEIDLIYTLTDGSVYKIRFEQFPESKKWSGAKITFATPKNAESLIISHRVQGEGRLQVKNANINQIPPQ